MHWALKQGATRTGGALTPHGALGRREAQGPQNSKPRRRRLPRAREVRGTFMPVLEVVVGWVEVVDGWEELLFGWAEVVDGWEEMLFGWEVGITEALRHSTLWKVTFPTFWFPVDRNWQVELLMLEQPFSVRFLDSMPFMNSAIRSMHCSPL